MPHELDGQVHWHEPLGLSPAGVSRYLRPMRPYDRYMEQEGLPILRASSVALADAPRAAWRRLAASGCFLQPFGTEGGLGCALLELAPSAGTRAEKHLFEEVMLVASGRGTTEIWLDGSSERVVFEWQTGSLFSVPPNALHRLVNATDSPGLVLCASNAPALLDLIGDVDAVFANPFEFGARFDAETGQAFDDIEPDPVRGLALCRTTLVPDAIGCDLPLDNRPSPGYRQMELGMTGPGLACAVGEHRPGRYARAQILPTNTIMVGLKGTGYAYLWPERLGPTPWRDGQGDAVMRVEQAAFTVTGAGPGSGWWYRQVFNTGAVPLRHVTVSVPGRPSGPPGEEMRDDSVTSVAEGGAMIPYALEDPFVRTAYAEALAGTRIINRMRDDDYES